MPSSCRAPAPIVDRRAQVPRRLQRQPQHARQAPGESRGVRHPRARTHAAATTNGNPILDEKGEPVWEPGLLKSVKAVGWVIPEFGCAQVSINLTDLDVTPLHVVFDACDERARERGLRVTGSEIVGLVPLSVLLDAGRHYLAKMGRPTGVPEAALVQTAIRTLGLSEVKPFDPKERVIEYRLAAAPPRLAAMSLREFLDELSSESPAPGGGSVSALAASAAAGLAAMVAVLSHTKKGFESKHEALDRIAVRGQQLKDAMLAAVDADTAAFDALLEAMRMPKATPEEQNARSAALADATVGAAEIPLRRARSMSGDHRAQSRDRPHRHAGLALRRRRRRAGRTRRRGGRVSERVHQFGGVVFWRRAEGGAARARRCGVGEGS